MGLIDDLGLDDPLACIWRSTSGRLKPAAWGSPSSVEKDLGRLDELLFKLLLSSSSSVIPSGVLGSHPSMISGVVIPYMDNLVLRTQKTTSNYFTYLTPSHSSLLGSSGGAHLPLPHCLVQHCSSLGLVHRSPPHLPRVHCVFIL